MTYVHLKSAFYTIELTVKDNRGITIIYSSSWLKDYPNKFVIYHMQLETMIRWSVFIYTITIQHFNPY